MVLLCFYTLNNNLIWLPGNFHVLVLKLLARNYVGFPITSTFIDFQIEISFQGQKPDQIKLAVSCQACQLGKFGIVRLEWETRL